MSRRCQDLRELTIIKITTRTHCFLYRCFALRAFFMRSCLSSGSETHSCKRAMKGSAATPCTLSGPVTHPPHCGAMQVPCVPSMALTRPHHHHHHHPPTPTITAHARTPGGRDVVALWHPCTTPRVCAPHLPFPRERGRGASKEGLAVDKQVPATTTTAKADRPQGAWRSTDLPDHQYYYYDNYYYHHHHHRTHTNTPQGARRLAFNGPPRRSGSRHTWPAAPA